MMTDTIVDHIWKAEDYHYNSSVQNDAATQLMQYIQLKGDEKILDVGCGDGKITAQITKYVPAGSVIGTDISSEMINFASKSFPRNHYSNLMFLLQDAQRLSFYEEFDIIFSSFALQWIPEPSSFFKCAYTSLKSSGYLVITIPLGISSALEESIKKIVALPEWAPYFQTFSPKWHFITEGKYRQLLAESRFIPMRFDIVPQIAVFLSRKDFERYVIQWFSYLNPLPEHLKSVFFTQIIDKYIEINPVTNGGISFNFLRVDIIAAKSSL